MEKQYPGGSFSREVQMAALTGNIAEIEKFLKNGGNINLNGNSHNGNTLLNMAIIARQGKLIKFLIDSGADANTFGEHGDPIELLKAQPEIADTMELMYWTKHGINSTKIRESAPKEIQDLVLTALGKTPESKEKRPAPIDEASVIGKFAVHENTGRFVGKIMGIEGMHLLVMNHTYAIERLSKDTALILVVPPKEFVPKSSGLGPWPERPESSQMESESPSTENQGTSRPVRPLSDNFQSFLKEYETVRAIIDQRQRVIDRDHRMNIRDKLHEPGPPSSFFADPAANFGIGAVKELFKSPFRALDNMTGRKLTKFAANKIDPKTVPSITMEEANPLLNIYEELRRKSAYSEDTIQAKNMLRSLRRYLPAHLRNEFD